MDKLKLLDDLLDEALRELSKCECLEFHNKSLNYDRLVTVFIRNNCIPIGVLIDKLEKMGANDNWHPLNTMYQVNYDYREEMGK